MTGRVIGDARWPLVPLRDVTADVSSWNPSTEPSKHFTYVDISSIDNQRCVIVEPKRLQVKDAPSRARRPIRKGDVLFSNVRTYLRNVAQVTDLAQPAVASTGFTLLRPTSKLSSRFLYHLVRSDFFISQVTPEQTGTHYPATSDRVVRGQLIPLPELAVQESLAQVLDAAEILRHSASAHVVGARKAIKWFRQAVLVAACSGGLTADWREDRPAEDASSLLKAIVQARRERARSAEEAPKTGTFELAGPRLEPIELPRGWAWAVWNDLADWITYGFTRPMPHVEDGIPIVTAKNVSGGEIDFSTVAFTTEEAFLQLSQKDIPRPGELLLTKDGSIGRVAVVPRGQRFCVNQSVAVVRFGGISADCNFLRYVIEAPFTQELIQEAARGSAIQHIAITAFGQLPVPVPPLAEQLEIVRRVNQLLVLAEGLLARTDTAARKVDLTSQAVLAKAFRGNLTPTGVGL